MEYAEMKSLDRMFDSLDDDVQKERLEKTTPGDADYQDAWKNARTVLKFCNVPWDEGYANVVGWASDEQRDKWFDALEGDSVTLDTAWNYKSLEVYKPSLGKYEGQVQVPIPYETALGYNYLAVTAFDQPLPQYGDWQRSRFHYHITGINKLSGSTTVLTLELDAWTEYICSAHIDGIDLERGHWPMERISAAEWLENPLESDIRMSEPEPDLPDVKSKTVGEQWFALYDEPIIVLACTADLQQPESWWSDGQAHDSVGWWNNDNPGHDGYSPRIDRHDETFGPYPITTDIGTVGRQQVGPAVTGSAAPVTAATSLQESKGIMTPLRFYALKPGTWKAFHDVLEQRYPQLIYTIKAVYVMPSRFVSLGACFVIDGVELTTLGIDPAWKKLGEYKVTVEGVGYDDPWKAYAKMYASQFLVVEVSDLHGGTATIGCEDLAGSLSVYARAANVWPFLNMQAFIDGVGGKGIRGYKVKPLQDAVNQVPQGLWEQLSMSWDIPTYAVYADNRTNAAMTYAQRQYERDRANKDYQRAMSAADTAYQNGLNTTHAGTRDSLATADADYRSGTASNDTVYNNAVGSANTALANEQATVTTARNNTNASAEAALANGNASAATVQADGNALANTDEQNGRQNFDFTHDSTQRGIDYDMLMKTIELRYAIAEYHQESTWLNERNDTVHRYASASIPAGSGFQMIGHQVKTWQANHRTNNEQGRVSDPSSGSIPKQASMSMSSSGVIGDDASFSVNGSTPGGDTTALAIWTGQLVAQEAMANLQIMTRFNWSHQAIDFASGQAEKQYQDTLDATVSYNSNQNDLTRDNNKDILERSIATRRANLARDYGTATGNNSRTYRTTTGNASRSYTTGMNNAQRTRDTSVGNAGRTHDTQAGNLARTSNLRQSSAWKENRVGEANLANDYNQAAYQAEQAKAIANGGIDARLAASYAGTPVEVAHDSGDGTVDEYATRGVDIKIRRLSKADEAQVGRTFQRYGYRMPPNTWISDPKLSLRSRYTYWQARDVWLTPDRMSETAAMFLRRILTDGTTVWSNPDNVLKGGLQ